MQIPESTIREVRERADIVEVLTSYGIDLKRAGSDFVALCPFHNEKTPSFHVHPNTGFYKCFGCGKSGDAIDFLKEHQGMTFIDALTTLANRYGVELKQEEDPKFKYRKRLYALTAQVCEFYRRCLASTKEAQIARDYLESRHIDKDTQNAFSIGYAPKDPDVILQWAQKYGFSHQELADAGMVKMPDPDAKNKTPYHRFAGRLMFAIKDSAGRVVAFSGRQLIANKKSGKYVNSPETEIFKKGNILYGLDKAAPNITKSPHREAILCEGQIDCIRLHTGGFPVAVAPQGTAFTAEHASILKRYADSAVLVFDDDEAGHKATIKAAGILLALGMPTRVISLPDGDDPDTFIGSEAEGKGPEGFRKLLDNAESAIAFQCRILRAKEINPNSIDAVQRISKAVLETIALCKNSILKDALLAEASAALGIPKDILQDEVGKSKVKDIKSKPIEDPLPVEPAEQSSEADEDDASDASDDCSDDSDSEDIQEEDLEPSPVEFALMSALVCLEGDSAVKEFLGAALSKAPQIQEKLSCPFVRDFISAYLSPDPMPLAAFAENLPVKERGWFDKAMAAMSPVSCVVLQELAPADVVRSLLSVIFHRP